MIEDPDSMFNFKYKKNTCSFYGFFIKKAVTGLKAHNKLLLILYINKETKIPYGYSNRVYLLTST